MFFNAFGIKNISPQGLASKIESKQDFFLLDVRTAAEHAASAIEGSALIPIQELPQRMGEIPRDREVVVYCQVGNRSAYACVYLGRLGLKVVNLEGGIAQWHRAGLRPRAGVLQS